MDKFVAGVQMPVMLVQARGDPWGSMQEVKRLYEAFTGDKKIWWLDGINERMETYEYVGKHLHNILAVASQYTSLRSNQT